MLRPASLLRPLWQLRRPWHQPIRLQRDMNSAQTLSVPTVTTRVDSFRLDPVVLTSANALMECPLCWHVTMVSSSTAATATGASTTAMSAKASVTRVQNKKLVLLEFLWFWTTSEYKYLCGVTLETYEFWDIWPKKTYLPSYPPTYLPIYPP